MVSVRLWLPCRCLNSISPWPLVRYIFEYKFHENSLCSRVRTALERAVFTWALKLISLSLYVSFIQYHCTTTSASSNTGTIINSTSRCFRFNIPYNLSYQAQLSKPVKLF